MQTGGFKSWAGSRVLLYIYFYHGPNISRAMVMWPPCWGVTDSLNEQTRINMSKPAKGRAPP